MSNPSLATVRRHSSWDERYNLYPVLQIETSLHAP
jgi:hypothetical protein